MRPAWLRVVPGGCIPGRKGERYAYTPETETKQFTCSDGKNMQNDGKQTEDMMTDGPKLTDAQIRDMLERATPGPWVVSGQVIEGPNYGFSPFPWYVAEAIDSCGPGDATPHNARLIAAAPDLARLALERGSERDAALARAEAAEAEREKLRSLLEQMADAFDEHVALPDANCSCHINPPCGDCERNSFAREALAAARAALNTQEGGE